MACSTAATRKTRPPWLYTTHGQLIVALLRRVALNLTALHRNVSRRGEKKRDVPWKDLHATALAVLLGATEADLMGLRRRSFPAQRTRGQQTDRARPRRRATVQNT